MAKIYLHLSEFYGNFPRKRVGSNILGVFSYIFSIKFGARTSVFAPLLDESY
jgi:hypothetical protein